RLGGREAMAKRRTLFGYRVEVWTANSGGTVGHDAGIEDYELVLGTCPPRLRALAPRAHYPCGTAPGSARFGALRIRSPLGARRRPDVVWTRSARIPVWGRRPQNAPAAATRIVRSKLGRPGQ